MLLPIASRTTAPPTFTVAEDTPVLRNVPNPTPSQAFALDGFAESVALCTGSPQIASSASSSRVSPPIPRIPSIQPQPSLLPKPATSHAFGQHNFPETTALCTGTPQLPSGVNRRLSLQILTTKPTAPMLPVAALDRRVSLQDSVPELLIGGDTTRRASNSCAGPLSLGVPGSSLQTLLPATKRVINPRNATQSGIQPMGRVCSALEPAAPSLLTPADTAQVSRTVSSGSRPFHVWFPMTREISVTEYSSETPVRAVPLTPFCQEQRASVDGNSRFMFNSTEDIDPST